LLLYLTPTLVLLINVFFFKGTFQSERIFGLVISYVGVAVVFGMELKSFGSNVWLGTTLCLGSAISYAIYLSYLGRVVKRIGVLRLAGLATTFACLLCIGHFLLVRPVDLLWVPPPVIGLSAINGWLCTFAPIVMTMLAIKRIGAPLASQSGMIGPVSTLALGVAFLGEAVTVWIMAGSMLVLGGVWLSTQKRKAPAVQAARS
jgi:drug/metabolite transporter (DMT)-like permease